ncbi:N-6 DNA methylase [Neisseria wadsworthii]|uniref:site-specific DNA-methyltransferase (adenine-specific) n=1 Tax=Neisseria wadsworthii 9715 TaxID=1030841 RepID=G4CN36_9NEIS|nr:N-6 DNA methylase [Neisseria wadsworthii]EGZ50646.1 hypothetical protein HMPREF9370_0495 [Neisseria wadsworthii 9715]
MADINKEIVRLFQSFGTAYRVADLFRDFIEVTAIVLMNQYAFDDKWEQRENRYHEIRTQYAESDFKRFAEILGLLIVETHSHREQGLFADILGCLYMDLGLGNPNSGQYFTPYNISKLMAAIVNQDVAKKLKTEPFVSVLEPTCGSGANVIAFAENVRSLGYTPAQHMAAVGIDIDALCVWMCFIQCQLYRIPAKIVHSDSLTNEFWAAWRTADWLLGGFGQAMADRISTDKKEASDSEESPITFIPQQALTLEEQLVLF